MSKNDGASEDGAKGASIPAAEKEQQRIRITTWSRPAASADASGPPRAPQTGDRAGQMAPGDFAAPFVETIASSFAEPRRPLSFARTETFAASPKTQAAPEPQKSEPQGPEPQEPEPQEREPAEPAQAEELPAPAAESHAHESPAHETPAHSPAEPAESGATSADWTLQLRESGRKLITSANRRTRLTLAKIRSAGARLSLPKRLAVPQSIGRLPSKTLALLRERPVRRELKIGLAAMGAVIVVGVALTQLAMDGSTGARQKASASANPAGGGLASAGARNLPETEGAPSTGQQGAERVAAPVPNAPSADGLGAASEPNPASRLNPASQPSLAFEPMEGESGDKSAPGPYAEASPASEAQNPAPESPQDGAGGAAAVPGSPEPAPAPEPDRIVLAKESGDAASPAKAAPAARPHREDARQAGAEGLDTAEARSKAALAYGKTTKDKRLIAAASAKLGEIYYRRRELDGAESTLRQSLGLYEELAAGDASAKEDVARTSNSLGHVYRERGQVEKAEKLFAKAASIDKELGKNAELAEDYSNLGLVYLAWRKFDLSEQHYLKSLAIQKELQASEGIANGYSNLGQLNFTRGDMNKAVEMFKKAIAVEGSERFKHGVAMDHSNLGVVYAKKRDFPNACASWRKARRMMQEAGMKPELERVQRALRSSVCTQQSTAAWLLSPFTALLGK